MKTFKLKEVINYYPKYLVVPDAIPDIPMLRRLSDITELEKIEVMELGLFEPEDLDALIDGTAHLSNIKDWVAVIDFLLHQDFDLFGLIESGQAIEKKILK